MGHWILGVVALICAVLWLSLLELTGFSIVAVSAGLLAVLLLTGQQGSSG